MDARNFRRIDANTPHGLTLAISFSAVIAIDRIRYDIDHRKIRNRIVVIGSDQLICADGLRYIYLALQHSGKLDEENRDWSRSRRLPW